MSSNLHGRKIVQVITEPTGGGAELLVRELHKGLLAAGIDSEVIFLGNRKATVLGPGEQTLSLKEIRSPLAVFTLRTALAAMRRVVPDLVVHSHLTWPFFITPLAAAGMGIPLCFTEHSPTNRRRNLALFQLLEPPLYREYARLISVSDAVNASLHEWIGSSASRGRMRVIQNGARLLDYKGDRRLVKGKMHLLSVGSLNTRKGFEWSLRAVAKLRDIVEVYTIVGEGPDRAYFEGLIRELELESIVRLAGWADDPTPYYHKADALLVPSLWEGFGLVCVEGMSTGLPIVASDVPGMRDILKDSPAAILVPAADVDALISAVRKMQGALASGTTFAEAAQYAASIHGIDRMVDGYISLYDELSREWFGDRASAPGVWR